MRPVGGACPAAEARRPGDTIHSELTIAEIRPSRSKPDRGMLMTAVRILNQRGEEVMTFKGMQLTRKRG